MGTLQTTIKLNDEVTKKLNNINRAINRTVNAMNNLNNMGSARAVRNLNRLAELEHKRGTQIQKNTQAYHRQNSALKNQQSAHNGIFSQLQMWGSRLRNILTMYYAIKGVAMTIGKAVGMSDKMTNADARLSLIADSKNPLKDIQAKSFGAAQRSSTDYLEFTKAVGKLGILAGDKFGNQDNIIKFVELMNKSFQISGAETSERNAAMLQITQAIASNRLQGDEFRSILENAPMVMDALAKSLGVGHKELKKLAKEGELTADVLIKAMFDASKQIESMYSKLPLTWERIWARMKNVFTIAFKPIQRQINRVFNSQKFARILDVISRGLVIFGNAVGWALGKLIDLGSWMIDIWDKYKNILIPIAKLLGFILSIALAYQSVLVIFKVVMGIALTIKAIWGAIAAALSTTLGVVVLGIMLIIGAIYLAVQAMNYFQGTSYNAVGVIAGLFAWLGAAIFNIVANLWNTFAIFAEFLTNLLRHPVFSIQMLFTNLSSNFLNLCIAMGQGWDGFVTNMVNHIIDGVNWVIKYWNKLIDMLPDDVVNKLGLGKGTAVEHRVSFLSDLKAADSKLQSVISNMKPKDYWTAPRLEYKGVADAYSDTYYSVDAFGEQFKNWDNFDLDLSKAQLTTLNGINDKLGEANNGLGDIAGNTGDTSKNTADTAKNTSSAYEQDYSYLRNWAYQSGMGSSIGYNIKIEQNNRNNIGSNMDLNRVVDAVRDAIIEGIAVQAEGV